MKIITINLPVQFINKIKGLVGDGALYPSRSELIRVAIREFLISEIKKAKMIKIGNLNKQPIINEKNLGFVQVPCSEGFKTYKIVDKAGRFVQ